MMETIINDSTHAINMIRSINKNKQAGTYISKEMKEIITQLWDINPDTVKDYIEWLWGNNAVGSVSSVMYFSQLQQLEILAVWCKAKVEYAENLLNNMSVTSKIALNRLYTQQTGDTEPLLN